MHYETVNHKRRASELRTDAMELTRRGFPMFAEVNLEMAEWLDPAPRERDVKPRRMRPVRQGASTTEPEQSRGHTPMRAPRSSSRAGRAAPRGTSTIGRNDTGRVLRQMGTN